MTHFVFTKALSSLTLTQSLWRQGVKLLVRTSTLTAARPGWVTQNRVSDSSLPVWVSGCITNFPIVHLHVELTTFCSSACHETMERAENSDSFFFSVVMIALNQFLPLALSWPADNRLPTQESKQTSQKSACSTSKKPQPNTVIGIK